MSPRLSDALHGDTPEILGHRILATLAAATGPGITRPGEDVVMPPGGSDRLLRWLLAAVAVFLAWKLMRGLKSMFWAVFGMAWVLVWARPWQWF